MKKIAIFCFLITSIVFSQTKSVVYYDGKQVLNGVSVIPLKISKEKPGILILPAWFGITTNFAKNKAIELSKLGYYTFVADIYGEGNYPKDTSEAGKIAAFYKINYEAYKSRIQLALDQLIKSGANSNNIVIIGYCFGGTGALEAARCRLKCKGVVSFHGGLSKDPLRVTNPINTKVLVCHGADDPYVLNKEVLDLQDEMRLSKADWQFISYSNAVHAFTDPEAGNDNKKGAAYNEKADKRSFEHLKVFLNEVLKK